MDLSIIVPTHHGSEKSISLLETIAAQENTPKFEVLLIANPPNPALEQMVKKWDFTRYLETNLIGVNHARNLGLAAAQGEIVLFIDDDCLMRDPQFLKKHHIIHQQNPQLDGLGGLYSLPKKTGLLARAYHFKQLEWVRDGLRPGYHADLLLGGNMSFKRNNISEIFFDEKIKFGGAETEFIYHLASMGKKTSIFQEPLIEHRAEITLMEFAKKAFLQGRGAAYLKQKKQYQTQMVMQAKSTPNAAQDHGIQKYLFLYEVLFLAGNKIKDLGQKLGFFSVSTAIMAVLFRKLVLTLKHWIFVDLWCALEAALFSLRNKKPSSPIKKIAAEYKDQKQKV